MLVPTTVGSTDTDDNFSSQGSQVFVLYSSKWLVLHTTSSVYFQTLEHVTDNYTSSKNLISDNPHTNHHSRSLQLTCSGRLIPTIAQIHLVYISSSLASLSPFYKCDKILP